MATAMATAARAPAPPGITLHTDAMTIPERRKVPPLVPKKKPSLASLRNEPAVHAEARADTDNTIVLPRLRAREEPVAPASSTQTPPPAEPSLEKLVEELRLDTEHVVARPRRNEPQAVTFDSLMQPAVRSDICIGGRRHQLKAYETPLERRLRLQQQQKEQETSTPPVAHSGPHRPPLPLKPKPQVAQAQHTRSKPAVKPKPALLAKTTATTSSPPPATDNTPAFLREAIQKRLQMAQGVPLPGMVRLLGKSPSYGSPPRSFRKTATNTLSSTLHPAAGDPGFPSPNRSHTIDNASLEKRGRLLVHPNKRRAKGPRRRLPTTLSGPASGSGSASGPAPVSTSPPPLRAKHKSPPPIRKPSRAIAIHS